MARTSVYSFQLNVARGPNSPSAKRRLKLVQGFLQHSFTTPRVRKSAPAWSRPPSARQIHRVLRLTPLTPAPGVVFGLALRVARRPSATDLPRPPSTTVVSPPFSPCLGLRASVSPPAALRWKGGAPLTLAMPRAVVALRADTRLGRSRFLFDMSSRMARTPRGSA